MAVSYVEIEEVQSETGISAAKYCVTVLPSPSGYRQKCEPANFRLELGEAPPSQVEEALMVDAITLLLLIANAVFFLAMLALVLWPLFAALLEILKVIGDW